VERIGDTVASAMQRERQRLQSLDDKATLLSPESTLKRGYALVRMGDRCITAANQLHTGDQVTIQLAEGTAEAAIKQFVKDYIRMIGSNNRYTFDFADNGSRE